MKVRGKNIQSRSLGKNILNYSISLAFVLLIASILIMIHGSNPVEAMQAIIKGSVGSKGAIASTIRWSTPVIIASMAAIIAQKSGINNLGLDGQIYFGALFAAIAGHFIHLPPVIHVFAVLAAAGVAGALYASIPGLLKIKLGINEMVVTLMLNYTAVLGTEYITLKLMGFGSDTNPDMVATPEIAESAKLIKILPPYQATTGIFIAVGIFIAIHLFYQFSKAGYEWIMIGRNPQFSKYGGINTFKNYMIIFLTSGMIAGFCGATEIMGPHLRFRSNFAQNLGWDGIMVSLIAKNHPVAALFVSLIWGAIKAGSLAMERTTNVNRVIVTLVQALFVLFVTVDFKALYHEVVGRKRMRAAVKE